MIISPENFYNKGEVDFTAHYKDGMRHGRASLRRSGNQYEVYVQWFYPDKKKTVLHRGSLQECIDFSNARFGFNDMVKK